MEDTNHATAKFPELEAPIGTAWPLLFTFKESVAGRDFFATVTADCRALAVREDDGIWMYGVNPGGMADQGQIIVTALASFREGFKSVLFDMASEASTFSAFKECVQRFVMETNDSVEKEWKSAVEAVRAESLDLKGMPRRTAEDAPARVTVEKMPASPDLNVISEQDLKIAA